MVRRLFVLAFALFFILPVYSQQEKKTADATKIDKKLKIDGKLSEPEWQKASPATGFYQYSPYSGGDKARFETEVKYLYTDDAIYVGAIMHDPSPDSIL